MAVVVLFSTLSFTIDMHYCGNILVDSAIFNDAKNCGMDMENSITSICSVKKKNCCTDKEVLIDGQGELQINVKDLTIEEQQFVALFVYSYFNLFEDFNSERYLLNPYKPPLVVKDIQKLDEVYLI